MNILGIDPGIADTGFGVIKKSEKGGLECRDYGSIVTDSKSDMAARLDTLSRELQKKITDHEPDLIAVEDLFFCKNVKTALIVGQARGVILLEAQRNNIQVEEFTPLQVKQAVSTYGKASKGQVQRMVKMLLNLEELPKPDDAADALAVGICAANSCHLNN